MYICQLSEHMATFRRFALAGAAPAVSLTLHATEFLKTPRKSICWQFPSIRNAIEINLLQGLLARMF